MARHAQKRKARKGRIFVTILVALLILVGVVAVIGYFQYQSSLKEAQNESKLKDYKFNGAKAVGMKSMYYLSVVTLAVKTKAVQTA